MAHTIPTSVCPVCRTIMDRTQCISRGQFIEHHPTPGSLSLCLCGTALKFNADLTLSELDPTDLIAIALKHPNFYTELMTIRQATSQLPGSQSRKRTRKRDC